MIRVLGQSQFQDWENHYYVDQRLLASSVQWILKNQKRDGTFEEPEDYPFPLELPRVKDFLNLLMVDLVDENVNFFHRRMAIRVAKLHSPLTC